MNTFNKDTIIGALGFAVGLIGVGYAIATRSKLAKVSERLDASIDKLAGDMEFDIPEEMINKAIEKAAEIEAKKAVKDATAEALGELKKDIQSTVSSAVETEYDNIKDIVLKAASESAAKIDVARVRKDVEKAAINKYECNLDDILEKFSENLNNTSRIYNSIASSMTRTTDSGKELVFKLN